MLIPTADEMRRYAEDGYFFRSGLLSANEVADFRDHARRQLESEAAKGAVM